MSFFTQPSGYSHGNLALALAPALTPKGIEQHPVFFNGQARFPQILARCLLVLADITATRYFQHIPVTQRDPVLSAQGDRLRAECFSACNGVYARLDLLQSGFEGDIAHGTTNVDIRAALRAALLEIQPKDTLKVQIGSDGLKAVHLGEPSKNVLKLQHIIHETPVIMPNRWVRALGNSAQIHRSMQCVFQFNQIQSQMFLAKVPAATGKSVSGWLTPNAKNGFLSPKSIKGAVYIAGLHRLSALKRLMTHITEMAFYSTEETGHAMIEATVPGARITLSLTAEPWQGYSGEGALLESLAQPLLLEDAKTIHSTLAFDATIHPHILNFSSQRIEASLAYLAVCGKLGYDAYEQSYFHRELPEDERRILKDNPRLVAARKLIEHVSKIGSHQWAVRSNPNEYQVFWAENEPIQQAKCTCTWYLNHLNKRGPCKHILAVQLKEELHEF